MRVAFFGECMIEHKDGQQAFGGDTLNTALYLARLTANTDIDVLYATGLGIDAQSQHLLECWQAEGIDTSLVSQLDDKLPGHYEVITNAAGERRFEYERDNSAAKYYFRDASSPLETAMSEGRVDALYFSGISLAILSPRHRSRFMDAIKAFKAQGGKVFFDNNYRPALWGEQDARSEYLQALSQADIALLTDEDEYTVFGGNSPASVFGRTDAIPVPEVVLKRGSEPCLIRQQGDSIEVSAEVVTNVVDTCAAGDAFAAGYLSERLQNRSVTAAAMAGHAMAAKVIQHPGAIIPR